MAKLQSKDETELISRMVQGDQAALSQLYDRYARVMYSLAFKILGSVEEAEEVVLDVFAKAWRTAARYDSSRSRVDSWLFLMTRSRSLDRLRQRQRQTKVVEAATKTVETSASDRPDEALMIAERRTVVMQALGELPDEQRLVIELAYYQGYSQSEIAKQTGLALGTVKTRIRLGLRKLKQALGTG
ncbi:sigma-70 family RNA polymerase sigma factor [Leptolyngbyaceae cyanobacterium CCMR0082]|uniref:Sigma-70 family RNA polymerase sigma factor n=2 Tax=Adonisia turfae TaxID=2950184 RepID=A0A6M0SFE3_9CYAN|nr:sigma-70 family RNA polymerase sigma factor [Adonisia turfae]MDV3351147.1 sigma-70 family RNA polymerase sigma factor [Leptothoe sp. LEGE 181152]NEZ56082.1 sigma-70 family RNA polymerase sigma factor [Adonisia turfae CCMR0081]NEZ67215.1 sigma-70 family RNA polymerase sigma factor [Adonisia turfae CCMR0082]